jgi:hypothetical protein
MSGTSITPVEYDRTDTIVTLTAGETLHLTDDFQEAAPAFAKKH